MKYWTKAALAFIGLGHLVAMGIVLTLTWYCAWFSGQYACIVYINQAGEALFEFFLVPICLVWGIWGFAYIVKHIPTKEDK